jgi:site-specific recombinase XerD
MENSLVVPTLDSTLPGTLIDKVAHYARTGLEGAANTQRGYGADLRDFRIWCAEQGQLDLPAKPATIAAYAAHTADHCKWSTLTRRLAAISKLHQVRGFDSPTTDKQVKIVLEGIKRTKGIRQKQAPAFTMHRLKGLLRGLEIESHVGLRNKALLLLGFTGAFRRSELVALNVEDLSFTEEGLIVSMGKSKTNQYGDYEEKAIYYSPEVALCPIRTLQAWINRLTGGQAPNPLFVRIRKGDQITSDRLTDKTVDDLVKQYLGKSFSAHSLRASFVTIAKLNGADDSEVMRQTKHKTTLMIQKYTRLENIRQHNAAMKLGL